MIVTCPECSTKFNLDPGRITGDRAKVRCSRCKYVFEITDEGKQLPAIPKAKTASKGPSPKKAFRKPLVSSLQAKRILMIGLVILIVVGGGLTYWFMRTPGESPKAACSARRDGTG